MSLHPQEMPPIPEETARVARAILPQGNRYLLLREELGTIYSDELFADVYPRLGQPAEPARCARCGQPEGDCMVAGWTVYSTGSSTRVQHEYSSTRPG